MDEKPLSASDVCDKFIRPAMEAAGWNGMDQIWRELPLRAELLNLARKRDVVGIRVPGSMNRDDANDESDVELLVTLAQGRALSHWVAFCWMYRICWAAGSM
ncbi:MAG: hypothetical protein U1F00_16625 [Rhodoferax sp.]